MHTHTNTHMSDMNFFHRDTADTIREVTIKGIIRGTVGTIRAMANMVITKVMVSIMAIIR